MAGDVRVRFAPSPTGHLHVGGARTALFNWLFARHHGGVFILRIEDTDRSRSTEENIGSILDALRWLELDWDEGPPAPGYRQTERFELYRAHATRLLEAGRAYYCDCPPELLEQQRKAAEARKETFRYQGRCRARGLTAGALRLRIPDTGATVVDDLIHGPVTFEHAQLDDWILVRTDGTPTYNFCVVVDDVTMRITHVIRGNDHLSNTPKQVLCYEALGYRVPAFAHVSMILGPDRARLSKRHGATAVQAYREQGILPEAMVNYLARLGWSAGDQEIFTRAELVARFDIKDVSAAGAVFDQAKLEWLSHEHLKRADGPRLSALVQPFLESAGLPVPPAGRLGPILDTLRERAKTLRELVEVGRFYLERPTTYEEGPRARLFTPAGAERLALLRARLAALEPFTAPVIEALYRALAAELGLKLVDLAQLTRLAVTGRTASPPLFDVLALLGRDEVLARLGRRRRGECSMRLLLARHGQSVWNAERRFQGSTDVALSTLGVAQARALGVALRGYRLAAAYVSPFRRAVETAEIALEGTGVPLVPLDELRELSLGQWEGCTVEEISGQAGDPYRAWLYAPHDCPPPGGEPLDAVSARVRAAVDRIAAAHEPGDDVAVIAHGGVISVYACSLLGCSFNQLWRLRVDNASLTMVRPPRLVSLNDTSHLTGALAPTHLQRVPAPARTAP